MDHLQHLLLLAGCLAVTPAVGLSGVRVRRRACAVLPVFAMWDAVVLASGV